MAGWWNLGTLWKIDAYLWIDVDGDQISVVHDSSWFAPYNPEEIHQINDTAVAVFIWDIDEQRSLVEKLLSIYTSNDIRASAKQQIRRLLCSKNNIDGIMA